LSVNLKWVAYLNFKQKWKSILLLVLVLIYVYYFFQYFVSVSDEAVLQTNLIKNIFVTSLFAFIFLYTLFSLLVILFNLPTSSVFEQKLEDVLNFQRLSQSVQAGETEDQVFDILLNSSVSAVLAEASWVEASSEDKQYLLKYNITEKVIDEVKNEIGKSKSRNILERGLSRKHGSSKFSATIKHEKYKSALVVPLIVKDEIIGKLVLLKDIREGFNKEMLEIVTTFANQVSISVENIRLLTEALENERYKEELEIAKRVQTALLPDKLVENDKYEIVGFTKAATEIGGDYYDTYEIDQNRTAIVIGDVSGKGTSAAFHMSQMKGIFQSLAQLCLAPDEFLTKANTALSSCLEKTSFITLTYYVLDTQRKTVVFSRAGHCPTLYFDQKNSHAYYFKNKGLGLGILRNSEYKNYVEVNDFNYSSGDIMLLYTDGIVEAQNSNKEDFGYDRLKSLLITHNDLKLHELQDKIIDELYKFCGSTTLDDDYSIVLVRFK
jgi:serine phosphatase RsbU (regulator of sigma subunit)